MDYFWHLYASLIRAFRLLTEPFSVGHKMALVETRRTVNHTEQRKARGNSWRRASSILFLIPAWFAPHKTLRAFFHRLRGVRIGRNVEIGYFCIIDNVHPHFVTIEDNAVVTAKVTILAHDNALYYTHGKSVAVGRTTICKNAFVGVNAVIMPCVTVGESAIVGANAVVTKDVIPFAVVAGVPAKQLRIISPSE